jgi:K+-transporting ATPase ATPase C chain
MLQFKRSLLAFVWLTVLSGLVYPLTITLIASGLFPASSGAGIVKKGDTIVGSHMIGQSFTRPEYFHGRPSAIDPAYDASNSGGSNLAPSSAKLITQVQKRVATVRQENGLTADIPVPPDLVLTSASGLDPHISRTSALLQAQRVANQRKISPTEIQKLIDQYTEQPLWGIWGKERVNVLELNLALDKIKTGHQ